MEQSQIVPQSESRKPTPEPDYHSYLLRMWLVQRGEKGQWRASLENVQTGEMQGFKDLPSLLAHLEGLTVPHEVRQVVLEQPTPDNGLD